MQTIIFTDLDGTLLDYRTYSFRKAASALNLVRKRKIPLVICSSKTKAEIEYYRKKLKLKDPYVYENGGGIFIPKDYFRNDKERIIQLGVSYKRLVNVLKKINKTIGFNDMTAKQLAKDCGLNLNEAKLAKKREFDEAFKIINKKDEEFVLREINKTGLNYERTSRYYHIIGNNDKGMAVKILKKMFIRKYKMIKTIGIGDSENDFKMLDIVSSAYLVQQYNGRYASNKYNKVKGIGPIGWNKIVKGALNE